MESAANMFVSTQIFLTGFDKARCTLINGRFTTLCFQIKPHYIPSNEWMSAFPKMFPKVEMEFSVTLRGVCYLTFSGIDIDAHELNFFVGEVDRSVAMTNKLMGNNKILTDISLSRCGLALHQDISGMMYAIDFICEV